MSRKKCCCGSSCTNGTCTAVRSSCSSTGFVIPSVRLTASVRIPGCYEPQCETFNNGPEGSYDVVGPVGCIRCYPAYINYPDCVPCRDDLLLGSSYWGNSQINYVSANPSEFDLTCDYSWNDGWYAVERNCGPGTPEFKCYDGTRFVPAGCAFLQYKTVSQADTIGPNKWKTCGGNSANSPVVGNDGYFGELCGGCSDEPQPCCCDDCTNCEQIRCDSVFLGGQQSVKVGRIQARILQMIPCTGVTQNASEWWCGAGCSSNQADSGYSRITIQLMADIPTVAIDANLLYQTQGGLIPGSPGRAILPRAMSFAQLGLADADGDYYCLATSAVTVTYRKCRSTVDSLTNKCQMEKGVYELVYIGTSGNCALNAPDCVTVSGTPCNPKEMLDLLNKLGWGVTVEVL